MTMKTYSVFTKAPSKNTLIFFEYFKYLTEDERQRRHYARLFD